MVSFDGSYIYEGNVTLTKLDSKQGVVAHKNSLKGSDSPVDNSSRNKYVLATALALVLSSGKIKFLQQQ